MLPSMPILFTRDSQDAFGNKIEPSTSYFNKSIQAQPIVQLEAHSSKSAHKQQNDIQNNTKNKTNIKKKEEQAKPNSDDKPLEAALVKAYYAKVQSRFASHSSVPTNKFVQFRNILKSFDPSMETPIDLFKKIEQLFGEEHKDIVEEFLLFLKPGQASQVGRFMDHFMMTQITRFIALLQTTFSRKPTVLRKIIRAITTSINSGNSSDLKSRVLPHLRSNPRLTQMFKSLFPDERPPDSVYETGTDILQESFLTSDKGYDVWEFEDKDNKRKPEAKVLDSEYLHGRVFLQHGRFLRTACVTYPYSKEPYRVHARRLAPNHCLSPPESDSERASPKRNAKTVCKIPQKRPRKQLKSPTKNAKDVNDNTKNSITTPLNNTKIKGKSHSRSKHCKKEDVAAKKKDKHDTKSPCSKKDEGLKVKQTKVDVPKVESRSWTRDEDKTMLEVLKGEPGSEQVFCRIREQLPHRTTTEIKERFCHVMNLLQKMAVGDVT
ncbi:uncharacterized protein LOC113400197 [Vanessa tameamea]|uniref:Uncharacterized protein LOC113400197 n=1 Tax=Vanessa tameamea TaxID=334116 RepID=A0A8B8IHB1_VANTA|nr:uncharacterized protein LOC113400197 [Vanessa tameamea]